MYTPKLAENLIHRLYLLAQKRKVPMTRLVGEAVQRYLEAEEKKGQAEPEPVLATQLRP